MLTRGDMTIITSDVQYSIFVSDRGFCLDTLDKNTLLRMLAPSNNLLDILIRSGLRTLCRNSNRPDAILLDLQHWSNDLNFNQQLEFLTTLRAIYLKPYLPGIVYISVYRSISVLQTVVAYSYNRLLSIKEYNFLKTGDLLVERQLHAKLNSMNPLQFG